MQNRRHFLKTLAGVGLLAGTGTLPLEALATEKHVHQLTILHTNDWHSRIEPFGSGSNKGLGGAAQRANLIARIRQQTPHVILLDAGDIFQGTPYFNFFQGELEYRLMNAMGYDAATIGNHDFDAGMEALQKQAKNAQFPLVNINYNTKDTPLDGYVKNYTIIQRGKIKIGVFGVGIMLDGLVPGSLIGKLQYNDPVPLAQKTAEHLKNKEKCHYVICLSHLGYKYENDNISDEKLAQKTSHIDLIIGGHTHTFLDSVQLYTNAEGKTVLVNQVGWAGIRLGRIDVFFSRNLQPLQTQGNSLPVQ